MKITIRSKLVLGISILMVVLFSLVALLLISEKKDDLADDIFHNSYSFAKLSSSHIADDYDLYILDNSFVYFNRSVTDIFSKNADLNNIQFVNYSGEILYDSTLDTEKKYSGEPRIIDDAGVFDQIRSEYLSLKIRNGEVYYLDDVDGEIVYMNKDLDVVEQFAYGSFVDYLVVHASEKYAVIYEVDYTNLEARVASMEMRIIYLAVFGVFLGILLAFILASNLTRPVHVLEKGVKKLAAGDFDSRVYVKTHDEISYLADAFNSMARDLKTSLDAKIYQERLGRELELAKQIQTELIPEVLPSVPGLDISALLIAADEIGGDMYDFLPSYPGHQLFYLGDVTGHGVPAGLVSSIASALFYGFSGAGSIKDIIIEVNKVFKVKTLPNIFMTLCLMNWEEKMSRFSYVSAGHEQIIHYSAASGEIHLLPAGGIALGMVPDISVHLNQEDVQLGEGDFIVVYSDGIPEAWRNEKENYGMDAFMQSVLKNAPASTAKDMVNAILFDLKNFTGNYKQMDDITLIVLKKLSTDVLNA